jgi:hypothetical protein
LVAAIAPKSNGSSTIGVSVVASSLMVIEPIDGGIVCGFDADKEGRGHKTRSSAAQNLLEHARRDFAAAPAAVRKRGQPQRNGVGGIHVKYFR